MRNTRDNISSNFFLAGGLRGEHDAPQGSVLEPSLGTSFQFGGAKLSANYAGAFRVPTIDELYYPGFSNPLLVPEQTKNLDTTLSLPLGAAGASLSWFDRQAVNLIALNASFVPENIARASLAGFVFSSHTAPFHGLVATLGVTDMYRALNLTPGQAAVRLDFQPVATTTLGLEKPFAGARIRIRCRRADSWATQRVRRSARRRYDRRCIRARTFRAQSDWFGSRVRSR